MNANKISDGHHWCLTNHYNQKQQLTNEPYVDHIRLQCNDDRFYSIHSVYARAHVQATHRGALGACGPLVRQCQCQMLRTFCIERQMTEPYYRSSMLLTKRRLVKLTFSSRLLVFISYLCGFERYLHSEWHSKWPHGLARGHATIIRRRRLVGTLWKKQFAIGGFQREICVVSAISNRYICGASLPYTIHCHHAI